MRQRQNELVQVMRLFRNIRTSTQRCSCHGLLQQIDARLPDGTPVRIMKSDSGYHVAVGHMEHCPQRAVYPGEVLTEIQRKWNEYKAEEQRNR